MQKAISNFINILSVKAQVALIVILAALGISIFVVFSVSSDKFPAASEVESNTERELQKLNQTQQLVRRHETDYFETSQQKDVKDFHKQVTEAIFSIDQLIKNADGNLLENLNIIKQDFFEYRHTFENAVKTNIELGNTVNSGLEGELIQAFNNLEAQISNHKQNTKILSKSNNLEIELLTLRYQEMNFMLHPEAKNLVQIEKQIGRVNSILNSSDFTAESKAQISHDVEIYSLKFQEWNQTRLLLEAELELLDDLYGLISPAIEELLIENELFSEFFHQQMLSDQKQSKTFLVVSVIIIVILLLAISIMILLFRQHEKFKNVVKQRATLLKQASELERINSENISLANLDTLTSLPNRRSFFSQLDKLIAQNAAHPDKKLFVGLLDLDGFKRVNDVFGHPAGDDLLIKSSQRLKDVIGQDIILTRLGGDEFGLIITNPDDIENILHIGNNICDAMRQTFHLKEGNVKIGATVGFVEHPSMAPNSKLMFERADYALCYSKQHSKGEPVIFSQEHESIIRDVSNMEHQLREADLDKEMSMMFQPIIDLDGQTVVGFEALARWNNPQLGNVQPDVFIKAAEQIGTIGKLTTILLRKALDTACQWPDGIYLSFNLSIFDLSSPQTVLGLVSIVEKSPFPSHRIVFEITETAVMHDFAQAKESLNLLKLQGAQIALDDFGTGYSSLSHVQRMPLDRLKIDRSFITDITTDKNTKNIVKTIIDLCNNLNLYCIVEGVETKAQLDLLHKMGCQYIQGYYFSRPLSPNASIDFLKLKTKCG